MDTLHLNFPFIRYSDKGRDLLAKYWIWQNRRLCWRTSSVRVCFFGFFNKFDHQKIILVRKMCSTLITVNNPARLNVLLLWTGHLFRSSIFFSHTFSVRRGEFPSHLNPLFTAIHCSVFFANRQNRCLNWMFSSIAFINGPLENMNTDWFSPFEYPARWD